MKRALLAVSLLAGAFLILSTLSGAQNVQSVLRSYLVTYLYWLGFSLGALPLLMILNLTGGKWGEATRGILEAQTRSIGLMAILFLPVLAGLGHLYPWADPVFFAAHPARARVYLNPPFFTLRALAYFSCWIGLAHSLRKRQSWSAAGLVVFGLTVTFAAIDWQMSLEAPWYSTIYGLLVAVAQAAQSWAFSIFVLTFLPPRFRAISLNAWPKTWLDIGNLLLTLLVLWAYLSFMQYLVIWSGNLPDEATWILARTQGGWQFLAMGLAVFGFAAPFSALLLRASKKRLAVLRTIAAWVLLVRLGEQLWMTAPAFYPGHFHVGVTDLGSFCVIGGLWGWAFLGKLEVLHA